MGLERNWRGVRRVSALGAVGVCVVNMPLGGGDMTGVSVWGGCVRRVWVGVKGLCEEDVRGGS